MVCYAYRRVPKHLERVSGEDVNWASVYTARLDTDTGVFQLLGDVGQPVAPPVDWRRHDGWVTHEHFYSWVNQYPQLWSTKLEDAFWFDPELTVDEGL